MHIVPQRLAWTLVQKLGQHSRGAATINDRFVKTLQHIHIHEIYACFVDLISKWRIKWWPILCGLLRTQPKIRGTFAARHAVSQNGCAQKWCWSYTNTRAGKRKAPNSWVNLVGLRCCLEDRNRLSAAWKYNMCHQNFQGTLDLLNGREEREKKTTLINVV